jgi:NAD(P)-dependent dehydrogenase (short-subunit alcohol dehydrogenase family)
MLLQQKLVDNVATDKSGATDDCDAHDYSPNIVRADILPVRSGGNQRVLVTSRNELAVTAVLPAGLGLNCVAIMTQLSSFEPAANVAVIGATGGIGDALCRSLASMDGIGMVHALSRSAAPVSDERIRPLALDLLDEASIRSAALQVSEHGPLDLVIVATGILHQDALQPEKAMRELSGENMLELFRINTVGPALVAKHFLPRMRRKGKSVFAALSARVGSIEDNRLGGWVSYRASKSALNMTLKTLAIEHARRWPDSVVAALHPGTVATGLSEPFRSRVAPEQLFTPETSASHLLRVIDGLTAADSGGCFAWDGSRIPY